MLMMIRRRNLYQATTHFNQASALEGFNAFEMDTGLREAVQGLIEHKTYSTFEPHLTHVGANCGSKNLLALADRANKHEPAFVSNDKYGNLVNHAEYDDSYHQLMQTSIEKHLVTTLPYKHAGQISFSNTSVIRSAISYMNYGLEAGSSCPLTMTYAGAGILIKNQSLFGDWFSKCGVAPHYDPRALPIEEKKGITLGMSMTSRVSGSDLRMMDDLYATDLQTADACNRQVFSLNGLKWFTSAPNSDGFLTLAKLLGSNSLTCFLVPKFFEGRLNHGFRIQRLKKKCGDNSNASSEVEYFNARAYLVGEIGKGVKEIMPMVNFTRLDCVVGSTGLMKRSLFETINFCKQRSVFGRKLIDQPIMRQDLMDMILEAEGHTHFAMYLSRLVGEMMQGDRLGMDADFVRLLTGIAKYYVTGRAPQFTYIAMEHVGGMGYINDFPYSRYYKQAPLNSIWEGSGNVQLLDIIKILKKSPQLLNTVLNTLSADPNPLKNEKHQIYAQWIEHLSKMIAHLQASNYNEFEYVIKTLTEHIALCFEAYLLHKESTSEIFHGFLISNAQKKASQSFGSLNPFLYEKLDPQIALQRYT